MASDELDLIRSRIDLVELVSQKVQLKKAGKNWKGLCPFHDDRNPSFYVNPDIGRYRCWSCGASGDAFRWVMEDQRLEFFEALLYLADKTGVALSRTRSPEEKGKRTRQIEAMELALRFFRDQLAGSDVATSYCKARELGAEQLERWELGYAPEMGEALAVHLKKSGCSLAECRELFLVEVDDRGGYYDKFRGRLMFPIRDERGALVAFGGRLLGDGNPKYINSGDTPLYSKRRVLYGMHHAKEAIGKAQRAVLVEGYLDAIACHTAGMREAVASLGTSLSEEHAKILRRWCSGVVVLYDCDPAGQKAAERASDVLAREGLKIRIALLPRGQDPDSILKSVGAEALRHAASQGVKPTDYRVEQLRQSHSASDEEYWRELLAIIAQEPSAIERSRLLSDVAPTYPAIRDAGAAERSLRAKVTALRRREKAQQVRPTNAVEPESVTAEPMNAWESALMQALLSPNKRLEAYVALFEEDLLVTQTAIQIAADVREAFPENPPEGAPVGWLEQLPSEEAKQSLSDLAMSAPLGSMEPDLDGALKSLRDRREVRRLLPIKKHAAQSDEALIEVSRRLQRRHESD